MKILFLHGFGSDPNGIRPAFLRSSGYDVAHPALPDDDFDESLRIAQQAFDEQPPDVLVGSSRGGTVAMNIDTRDVPLVLIAPAWTKWGSASTVGPKTIILHSDQDDVVPIDESRRLIQESGLPEDRLIVAGRNHRMVDDEAFMALLEALGGVAEL
jgi:hypothetical protein